MVIAVNDIMGGGGILRQGFTEMFLEWCTTKYVIFVQSSEIDCLPCNQKRQFEKNIKKSSPQKPKGE